MYLNIIISTYSQIQKLLRYLHFFILVFLVSSNKHPGVELQGHVVVLFFIFWGLCTLFQFYPHKQHEGSLFSTSSPTFICCLFDDSHSDGCELISHWFAFPSWFVMLNIFSYVCWPYVCMSSVEKCLFRFSAQFLIFFFMLSCISSLYVLDIIPYQLYHLQISSLI